jgi:Zinc carboxypeptidase
MSRRLSRRARLGMRAISLTIALATTVGLLAVPVPPEAARAQSEANVIGYTQMAQLLVVYSLGSGPISILVMGGQHGWPEENTVRLSNQLYDYFAANPSAIPQRVRLDFLSEANPDGLLRGSRQYISGVDPNRNWDGPGWETDAWDSNGVFRRGLGGPEPFSEPETRATRDYVLDTQPRLVVNFHSRGGFLLGGRTGPGADVADAYATASGYYRPGGTPGGAGGAPSVLGYRATGSMNVWLGTVGITGVLIELTDSFGTEYSRNLAGLQAALNALRAQATDTMPVSHDANVEHGAAT